MPAFPQGATTRREAPTGPPTDRRRRLFRHPLAMALVAALLLALLTEMPWLARTVRAHLLQVLAAGVLALLAAVPYQEDVRRALRRGPTPWLLVLLVWCVVAAAYSPFRAFASAELLRMLLGGGVYFAAAYALRPADLRPATLGALGLGAVVAAYGFIRYDAYLHPGTGMTSLFANHEQFGSYLMLSLPVALVLAVTPGDAGGVGARPALGAQVMALLIGGGLGLALTRSAWIGGALALLIVGLLLSRSRARDDADRAPRPGLRLLSGPLPALGVAFAVLLLSQQFSPLMTRRLATLAHGSEDASIGDRLLRARAACRMAAARPWTGWGLGSFPVLQEFWTGQGDEMPQVLMHGTGHTNLAHDFWAQWAAETGAPGLFLYVGTVTAFLLSAGRAVPTMRPGFRRSLLIGCLAATAGACGDMIGAPSYTFPGVSTLAWFWMGLGIAACREEGTPRADGPAALPATPPWVWGGAALAGLSAALAVLAVGARPPAHSTKWGADLVPQKMQPLTNCLTVPSHRGIVGG